MYDVPLIYETRSEKKYNLILLANCNMYVQEERVIKRDKVSKTLFKKIIASQLSFEEKLKFEPKIINTNCLKIFILTKVIFILIEIFFELRKSNGRKKKTYT